MKTRIRLIVLLAGVAGAGLTQASQIRPLNLEQMTARAASIFAGRCVEVRTADDTALGSVTLATFEVIEQVKGQDGATITVRLPGNAGAGRNANGIAGVPSFAVGEEALLFLYGESRAGARSPVGLGQGKFRLIRDKTGRRIAVNATGNATLFRELSSAARAKPGFAQAASMNDPARLEESALLDMVRALNP